MSRETTTEKGTPGKALDLMGRIKLLSVDVDGVLTDGGIYYADNGNTFRKFNAKDGMGLVRLRRAGVEVTIISAGAPGAIEHRAARLGIQHVFTDVGDKLETFRDLVAKLGLEMSETAHICDDVNDLKLMEAAGLAIATTDAANEVLAAADVITAKRGGEGAVREVCDAILKAHGAA